MAQAQDLFENETGADGTANIALRHRASGFLCLMEPGQRLNSVAVYPNLHRGDDVGCNTVTSSGTRTTNFTRDDHTDEQTLLGAASEIEARFPDAVKAPPPTRVIPMAGAGSTFPVPKSARYLTTNTLEEVISAHVDGWLVEDRFTAPRAFADSNALDLHWYFTVAEHKRHRQRAAPPEAQASTGSPPLPPAGPPAAYQISLAKQDGDRILLANRTQALFDNITDSKTVTLRHKQSGLVCRFDPSLSSAVFLGRLGGGSMRPDAVNCTSGVMAFSVIVTIAPNDNQLTLDQALAADVQMEHEAFPGLQPFTGQSLALNTKAALPPHRAVQLVQPSSAGSTSLYSYVGASVVGTGC